MNFNIVIIIWMAETKPVHTTTVWFSVWQ